MSPKVLLPKLSAQAEGFDQSWFRDAHFPLIRLRSDEITFASGLGDKRRLMEGWRPTDTLLMPWPGQWSQSVFHVDDVRALCASLQRSTYGNPGAWDCPHEERHQ